MKLTIQEILDATQGRLLQGNPSSIVQSISTDSRTIQKGEYFLCLIGENFDGHQYIDEVVQKGAAGIILQKSYTPERVAAVGAPQLAPAASGTSDAVIGGDRRQDPFTIVAVQDTLHALGNIARAWRRKFDIPLLAVGGSNGKTTTKDMCAAVYSSQFNTLATEGNFNNLIGVPKMLMKLDAQHEAAVIEMGMNDFGEMARLTEIAEPTLGLLTNTGYEHVEKMKDLEGVAKSNGEMFDKLPSGALALVNADDEYIPKMSTRAYKISFGMENPADVFCESFDLNDRGITLNISFRGKKYSFEIPVQGKANVKNALAAIASGFAIGIEAEKMKKALANYRGRAMRMEILKLKRDIVILNDCYNANPSSVLAALETLVSIKKKDAGLAILGEMKELGNFVEQGHRLVGEAVAQNKISHLISVGPFASQMVEAAIQAGMNPEDCFAAATQEAAQEKILSWVPECKTILVKGSRGARMEKITELISQKFTDKSLV